MAAQFPEPPSLNILEIGDGKDNLDKLVGTYTLDKPHPGYGKDPNIINHYGHTVYPKMVYPGGNGSAGVVVKSAEEEAEVMGTEVKKSGKPKADKGWT
jgi:hypothetical protein